MVNNFKLMNITDKQKKKKQFNINRRFKLDNFESIQNNYFLF